MFGGPVRFAYALLLTLALTSASAQEPAPASEPDLSSPRATLLTFLEAMNAVQNGRVERLDDALSAIYLQDVPPNERRARGNELAQQVYEILDSVTIDANNIPEQVEGRELHVELGEEKTVPLDFRLNDDGKWRFSRTLLEANVDEVHEAIVEDQPAEVEETSSDVNPLLTDPRTTMMTFLNAFGHWTAGGREEAVATLDLSGLDVNTDAVRMEKGEELAVQLKQVLDRDRLIVPQLIPNDPNGKGYMHLRDRTDVTGQRVVEIVPVAVGEDSESHEWKFSKRTVEAIPALWERYKDLAPVAGVNADTPQLVSLQLRTWVAVNAPILMKEPFLLQNWQWLGLLLIIALGLVISRITAYIILLLIRRNFRKRELRLEHKLERDFVRPIRIAIMAWVWYLALRPLGLPANVLEILRSVAGTLSAIAVVWALYRLIDIIGSYIGKRALETEHRYDDLVVPLIVRTLKIFVVAFGIVFVAQVNGWNIQTALAGLGIGGLAFALAAQDTLGNLFGSLTVLVDRPFQIGDWVALNDVEGTVETVGIRSTRIRTFYNSLVTVPNSQLTSAVIDNFGQRQYRRTKAMIGVTYDTPPEKIDAFCEGIRELIRRHPYTRKDYFHVYFNAFGPSSLDILLYCFHECPDWGTELRERHRLYVDIVRLAERLGVEFAFPTSTVHLYREDAKSGDGRSTPVGDTLELGRREARSIVEELLGTEGKVPPPVTFQELAEGPDEKS